MRLSVTIRATLIKRARSCRAHPDNVPRLESSKLANVTPAIFSLGGATLDNEWNHIQQKLMRGLGIVAIENQARI